MEGKADRTVKGYAYICPIFRLDKTILHHGLEKLRKPSSGIYFFITNIRFISVSC